MRVPFFRGRKKRSANDADLSIIDADNGGPPAAEPVSAGQGTSVPLPRRRPGSHGAKVVTTDPAPADLATLRQVLDRLNRM